MRTAPTTGPNRVTNERLRSATGGYAQLAARILVLVISLAFCSCGRPTNTEADPDAATSASFSFSSDNQDLMPPWRSKGDCGRLSLYAFMRLDGSDVAFSDIQRVVPCRPDSGCTMTEIVQGGNELGFPLELRFISPQQFKKIDGPYIIHTQGSIKTGTGHYLLVLGYNGESDTFTVVDTTFECMRDQTADSLLRDATGYISIRSRPAPAVTTYLLLLSIAAVALVYGNRRRLGALGRAIAGRAV